MSGQTGPDKVHAAAMVDEHAVHETGPPVPLFRGNTAITEHTFFYSNKPYIQSGSPAVPANLFWDVNPGDNAFYHFMTVMMNHPFPITAIPTYDGDSLPDEISTNLVTISERGGGPAGEVYLPNGLDPWRQMYKYYKVESNTMEIEITNAAGMNITAVPKAVRIGSYVVNYDGTPPHNSVGGLVNPRVAYMDPKFHPTCGDAILGTPAMLSNTWGTTTSSTWSHYLAPVFKTTLQYNADTHQPADDPTKDTKILNWSSTNSMISVPGDPYYVHFYFMEAFASGTDNTTFAPHIRIKSKVRIHWRDLYEGGKVNTNRVAIGTRATTYN